MKLTEIENFNAEQSLFDSFNGFMLSSDLKVFGSDKIKDKLNQSV